MMGRATGDRRRCGPTKFPNEAPSALFRLTGPTNADRWPLLRAAYRALYERGDLQALARLLSHVGCRKDERCPKQEGYSCEYCYSVGYAHGGRLL